MMMPTDIFTANSWTIVKNSSSVNSLSIDVDAEGGICTLNPDSSGTVSSVGVEGGRSGVGISADAGFTVTVNDG